MIERRLSLKIQILSSIALAFVVLQHSSADVESCSAVGFVWRNAIAYGVADYPVSFFFCCRDSFFLGNWIKIGILQLCVNAFARLRCRIFCGA